MQFTTKFAALLLAVAPLASSHIIMDGGWAVSGQPSHPLEANGSNYPCTAGPSGSAVTIAKGSQAKIGLKGSAVHGGGSCQISITYDQNPSKSSKFTVIKSFQGGCPISAAGNLPANPENALPGLPYTIPSDAPTGSAVVAWTWFNKIGNREMYMRCQKINITGGAGDNSKWNKRPDILKANIGNGCSTREGDEVKFPNPGDVVVGAGSGSPVGNCGPSGGSTGATPGKGGSTDTKPTPQQPTTPQQPKPQQPKPQQPSNGGGSCSGGIVCTSSTTWAMCSNGTPIPMGAVAAGTKCSNGAIVAA